MESTTTSSAPKTWQAGDQLQVLLKATSGVSELATATLIECLGTGAQGQVWKASVGAQVVAVKLPNDVLTDMEELLQEGQKLAKVAGSPSVINVLGYVVPQGKTVADKWEHHGLVLEYQDTSLWKLMGDVSAAVQLSSEQMFTICIQVLVALLHLNRKELVHCDVKSQNILVQKSANPMSALFSVVLADFGSAQHTTVPWAVKVGTAHYMCPVQFLATFRRFAETGRPFSLDVWGLGVVLAELFCGKQFAQAMFTQLGLGNTEEHLRSLHQRKGFTQVVKDFLVSMPAREVPAKWKRLILTCLDYNPDKRPSPKQLLVDILSNSEFEQELSAAIAAGIEVPAVESIAPDHEESMGAAKPTMVHFSRADLEAIPLPLLETRRVDINDVPARDELPPAARRRWQDAAARVTNFQAAPAATVVTLEPSASLSSTSSSSSCDQEDPFAGLRSVRTTATVADALRVSTTFEAGSTKLPLKEAPVSPKSCSTPTSPRIAAVHGAFQVLRKLTTPTRYQTQLWDKKVAKLADTPSMKAEAPQQQRGWLTRMRASLGVCFAAPQTVY